ncbi:hypothetical protein BD410DRAFT_343691 [Rickenella mellea]|uniref:MARVEL domain-containing protein n=1 Tax=Rickenella mellea TaxID=50990 RepID=A0A4Y7QML2_9AGAM|nr:hypothetical protein BD410DRAFT_343691 [Rickenella mellea]
MAIDKHVRRGHPIVFGLIIFFAIIQASLATWLTQRFNQHHNYLSVSVRDRTRFLLFTGWWTVFFSLWYLVLFWHAPSQGSVLTSVGSHGVFLLLTWIFWTAGAASITAALGGGYNCSRIDFSVPYCNQLNALEGEYTICCSAIINSQIFLGFSWAVWILVTIALIVVIFRGISSSRRGDGFGGQLVD